MINDIIYRSTQGVTQGSALAPDWFKFKLEQLCMNDTILKQKVIKTRLID